MNNIESKKIYFEYFNTRKKWLINNANIWFNKMCINNQLTPKFAQSKNKTYSKPSKRSNIQYVKLRLQNEINYLYTKKNFLSLKLPSHPPAPTTRSVFLALYYIHTISISSHQLIIRLFTKVNFFLF